MVPLRTSGPGRRGPAYQFMTRSPGWPRNLGKSRQIGVDSAKPLDYTRDSKWADTGPLAERKTSNGTAFPAQPAFLGEPVLATAFPASENARPGVDSSDDSLSLRLECDSFSPPFPPGPRGGLAEAM